jgi:hypothetical protein
MYRVTYRDILPAATTMDLLVTGGPYKTAMRINYETDTHYSLYESSTLSNSGLPLPIYDMDRSVATTPPFGVYKIPTVVALGTKLTEHYGKPSEDYSKDETWYLTPSGNFIVRTHNDSASMGKKFTITLSLLRWL